MKGDFSRWWEFTAGDNLNGVLPQQGRVVLDSEGAAQARITNRWQDTAARDIIGAGIAAVPANAPDSFKISGAQVIAGEIKVSVTPGRVWADGVMLGLDGAAPVTRTATYLVAPVSGPADGDRDAVVLEVWREALNGFQTPAKLIEPALGGPDSAGRILTGSAFRLVRMAAGENCDNLAGRLRDDFTVKGKLTATLQPTVVLGGDCPLIEGGGYTGFEHNLYRVEIAGVSGGGTWFKWSQFNGGLVGRGVFHDGATQTVAIVANLTAIQTSDISQFYLEAEEFNPALGHWEVTYGASVTLAGALLTVTGVRFGTIPNAAKKVFFRLWNDIRAITDFPIQASPNELRDGIRLEFEADGAGKYTPRDYWTFPVRAGGIGNDPKLLDARPPQGIHYHRVPLAELEWDKDLNISGSQIEDCRQKFLPLTRLSNCCSYRVGDGISSHGDFLTIQDAIDALPAGGGEICVLPGVYKEDLRIWGRLNVSLHGCGPRSRIVSATPAKGASVAPVVHVRDSRGIRIECLSVQAIGDAIGILLEGVATDPVASGGVVPKLRDAVLSRLRLEAGSRPAVQAHSVAFTTIRECDVRMRDVATAFPAIFFLGDDSLIERNEIRVRSGRQTDDGPTLDIQPGTALGGLQIGGTSDRVRIIDNLIQGGIGNGISLGSIIEVDAGGKNTDRFIGWVVNASDPCTPCKPGTVNIPPRGSGGGGPTQQSAGALSGIRIERNRIYDMGLNGIGVIGFFDISQDDEIISVERLTILGNHIRGCLLRQIEAIPVKMLDAIGYGGIALADVDSLIIWDNVIEDNGPSRLEPVCGVFVLHGEGIDICRNRILNNGARTTEPATAAKDGRRGGINVVHATAPALSEPVLRLGAIPVASGVPAVKVHENIVAAPLGQALSIRALGAVSVVGNQFTTHGVFAGKAAVSEALFAATVFILDLGLAFEVAGRLLTFASMRKGQVRNLSAQNYDGTVFTMAASSENAKMKLLANGNVLFACNQCVLDLLESGASVSASSIAIASLDDVAFHDNQCSAALLDDFIYWQVFVFAFSTRVTGNRMQEGIGMAIYSAVTAALMNTTAHNQSTHCLAITGSPNVLVNQPNSVLLEIANRTLCGGRTAVLANFGKAV